MMFVVQARSCLSSIEAEWQLGGILRPIQRVRRRSSHKWDRASQQQRIICQLFHGGEIVSHRLSTFASSLEVRFADLDLHAIMRTT
ncbi:hypothetical protein Sjap_015315 [Stephania japonica]|uniref:Uncharacterized protein n=1 Tax=Stephania japonica TaxID=461633 RepID=A0AAP0IJ08_9MAGN